MRDLYYDAEFMRDFNAASKNWEWANWHQVRASQEAKVDRLLESVFASSSDDLAHLLGLDVEPEQ